MPQPWTLACIRPNCAVTRLTADSNATRDDDHLRRLFREAVKRSGIRRRITPHDTRRSTATHLHLAGMPLKRLQDILGHNSLEVTRLYILEDETEINGSHSPFDLLSEVD